MDYKFSAREFIGDVLMALGIILLLGLMYGAVATASERTKQYQDQYQKQTSKQMTSVEAAAAAESFSEGGNVSISSTGGNDTVFVPNNNSEGCLRVFGLGIPTKDGAVILGVPWRSGECDLEASADDAFAQGNMALGWAFKCKMKGVKKRFGGEQGCLDLVSETIDMQGEIDKLREQKAVLLREREFDREECDNRQDRMNESLNRCFQKVTEDK